MHRQINTPTNKAYHQQSQKFVTTVLRGTYLPLQCLPSPVKYCHGLSYGLLVLIITENLPAPLAFIEMISSILRRNVLVTNVGILKIILFG